MAEILSQDEIDQLLKGISSGDSNDNNARTSSSSRKIKIYDFKRPDILSREQIRFFSNVFDIIARDLTKLYTTISKKNVHVHVVSADQLTYEEFIRSIPVPTEFSHSKILQHSIAVEFDPEAYHGLTGKMEITEQTKKKNFFGSDSPDNIIKFKGPKNRDLTDKEIEEFSNLYLNPTYQLINRDLSTAFESEEKELGKISFENNPQIVNVLYPTDMIVLITLEAKFDEFEGLINVALSKDLAYKLLNIYNKVPEPDDKTIGFEGIADTYVPIEVSLGRTFKSINDVTGMGCGTIIELDKLAGEPVDIKVNNKIVAKGEVVVIDENFGVRIVEVK